jgi:hypothetical protein
MVLAVGFARPVMAQSESGDNPKIKIFGGYSFLRWNQPIPGSQPAYIPNYLGTSNQGAMAEVALGISPNVSLVANFGGWALTRPTGYTTPSINAGVISYLFGPRYNFHLGKFTPFAQGLAGGSAIVENGPYNQNTNAFAFGGGFDWAASHHLGIRPIQVEYYLTRFRNSNIQNNIVVSTGVTYSF